jgi:hypothetical protein
VRLLQADLSQLTRHHRPKYPSPMIPRRKPALFALLLAFSYAHRSLAQFIPTTACATFDSSGALSTGTIRDLSDIEIKLSEPNARAVTAHVTIPFSKFCEQAFSIDGSWLATVVRADALYVVIVDRKSGHIQKQFSLPWQLFRKFPFEPESHSAFLAGFLPDNSLALWRYVPHDLSDPHSAPSVDLHMQSWSLNGELLSDRPLGDVEGGGDRRGPIPAYGLSRLWVPAGCTACYQGLSLADGRIVPTDFLTVPGEQRREPAYVAAMNQFVTTTGQGTNTGKGKEAQKAVLFDHSGEVKTQVDLPIPTNMWGALVPDWLYADTPRLSSDGQIAAIYRSRVAWVLVDTDRDWGSEVNLLDTDPLRVITTYKTGHGGIQALAVDHRNSTIRLVGFWKDHWHDLRWDQNHPGIWKKAAI